MSENEKQGAYAGESLWIEDSVEAKVVPETPVEPPAEHIPIYRTAISPDENLENHEIVGGREFASGNVTVPEWPRGGGRRFLYFGVDSLSNDISDLRAGGFVSVIHAYERVPGEIKGTKWWKSINDQSDAASGAAYTIVL